MLIHGFSPVNARLLTVYGTAFYAITMVKCLLQLADVIVCNIIFVCLSMCVLFLLNNRINYKLGSLPKVRKGEIISVSVSVLCKKEVN